MKKGGYPVFILTAILVFLAIIIAGGTIYVFVTDAGRFAPVEQKTQNQPVTGEQTTDFSGLGLSRFVSAGDQPCTVIAAPYFRYNPSDLAFVEELAKKTRLLNSRIGEWFAGIQPEQLERMDESFIKEQLTELINKELVLGSIETIYFDEFLIIE